MITYKFRIKDATSRKRLNRMAGSVNFVWNYCNEVAMKAAKQRGKWLSAYDLHKLTSACATELGVHSQTIQRVCTEYATRRKQFKKFKLNWRSKKRSLGWIPFKANCVKIEKDTIIYCKKKYKFWDSRKIEGEIKEGSFVQDARGRWYVCLQCEVADTIGNGTKYVGIDLGLKEIITCSDGRQYSRENYFKRMESKLGMAQRANKKKLVKAIHAKIANARKDWNHKVSTTILSDARLVVIGDVSSSKLKQTKLAKSVSDVAWSQLRSMFAYKSKRLGIDLRIINEAFSTQICSSCNTKTGPKGYAGLGVREWECSTCGTIHNRDVNAAINILRMGLHTPVGNPQALAVGR
jgi:IS605 OrfB family transposase